ncbi:hypothetical protein BWQ96_08589 [Gracilariopsis chorda]|uniref:Uncharacterized protein n=1 Tax=Gracilariopsis chorda TaxID=448386 RepID=A0A2V3IHY4_9FLOR|nr:hypothetical protein BWQ96_08589 [Gracilariopsis chorda]|eukprot:PXF41704.1 hypothetical protein BWQ96_08589 [Gracilariopsis chorda]
MCGLPVVDTLGSEPSIPFYITDGDGLLLLGNGFVDRGNLLGQDSLLTIPAGVAGNVGLALQTYNSRFQGDSEDSIRTRLLVVPSNIQTIKSYFVSFRGLYAQQSSEQMKERFSDGKICKKFASKLHGFTRMPPTDMEKICSRVGVLKPVLK